MSRLRRIAVVNHPTGTVYRIAPRKLTPYSPRPWTTAQPDGTFNNRFDDPGQMPDQHGRDRALPTDLRFRIVYCATNPIGAFGETLARMRASPSRRFDDSGYVDDFNPPENVDLYRAGTRDLRSDSEGVIPAVWRANRVLCSAEVSPTLQFADFGDPQTIQFLRHELGPLASSLGLTEIDFSTVIGPMRRFTQEAARLVYEQADEGVPTFAGIRYVSRLAEGWECWALFHDRIQDHIKPGFPDSIMPDNPDLVRVAELFGLQIETVPGTYLRS